MKLRLSKNNKFEHNDLRNITTGIVYKIHICFNRNTFSYS